MRYDEHREGCNVSESIQAVVSACRQEAASWRYSPRRRDEHTLLSAPRSSRAGVQRALTYMELNLGERFSLETLAKAAGLSPFHFARVFRLATGCSPMQFVMRRRVERAQQLLPQGEMTICDIAMALGFCDQSHFTRTFRRVAGMSPRQYLKSLVSAA